MGLITELLPESWYAGIPEEVRLRRFVEQWRKLHLRIAELESEIVRLNEELDECQTPL